MMEETAGGADYDRASLLHSEKPLSHHLHDTLAEIVPMLEVAYGIPGLST